MHLCLDALTRLQVILEKRRFASIFGSGMEFCWKEVGGTDFLQQLVIQCNAFQVCSRLLRPVYIVYNSCY